MFITLYGVNNIGKTTHTKRLVERLIAEGYDAVRVKFPVYEMNPSGSYLDNLLRSGGAQAISEDELQLWFVLNRYQFQPTLKSWLDAGKIVVAEDYVGTGIAWGTTKGASLEWLEAVNSHLLKSDLSIMLDGERKVEATEANHLHETDTELMKRCREVHLELAEKYGWTKISLQPTKEATHELIWQAIAPRLGQDA